MRVNVAVAVLVPTVAEIEWLPVAMLGIVIVAVKAPVEVVVMLAGLVAIALPSSFMVTAILASKLLPVTVTAVPIKPLVGERVIDVAPCTVNVAVPTLPVSSVAVTV